MQFKSKTLKPNRKGKKNWRKNIDISKVEDELDEIRAEERLGGSKIHVSENLFTLDKTGDVSSTLY